MKQRYFVLFLLLLPFSKATSQGQAEDVTVNTQAWLDYNVIHDVKENKTLSGYVGFRSISPHIYNNFLVQSSYNIANQKSLKFLKLKKPFIHSFHLGTRLNYISNKNNDDNFEFRLTEGFNFYLPSIKQIPLKNYIRFEQRFQKSFDGSSWNVGFRFRYKIATIIQWDKLVFNFTKGLYIPLHVEFFVNLKKADRFNDVIRISPGLGYKLNEQWKFELSVSYHNTLNTLETDNTSNDFVLRLRVFNSSLKKKAIKQNKDEQIKELIE